MAPNIIQCNIYIYIYIYIYIEREREREREKERERERERERETDKQLYMLSSSKYALSLISFSHYGLCDITL